MKTKYSRHIRIRFIKISLFAATVAAFFLPSYTPFESKGDNYFSVSVNGEYVGTVGGLEDLDGYVRAARKKIASVNDVVKEGQQIPVKLIEIDKMGRLNLSYIDAIEAQAK